MRIDIVKFLPRPFVELAVDEANGQKLIGIPFDHGGAGHVTYWAVSDADFEACLADESAVDARIRDGTVAGGHFYYSTFAALDR